MLSYMLPVEEKPPPVVNKNHLQLELEIEKQLQQQQQQQTSPRNGAVNGLSRNGGVTLNGGDKSLTCNMAPTTIQNFINIEQTQSVYVNGGGGGGGGGSGSGKKIIKTHVKMNPCPTISTESSASSLSSKASDVASTASQGGATPTSSDKLKPKLIQNGGGTTKTTSLKRVSFGSSKGSMVETLIYESPLQEEPEVATPTTENPCPFSTDGDNSGSDSNPSTKVRVTFFESERPLVVHSPEPGDVIIDILDAPNIMTSVSPSAGHPPQYHRQASTDSGWDNPFRPDGDLSREADEIVERIKEGKPITPTPGNGTLKSDEIDSAKQANQLSASPQKGSNGTANCSDKPGVVDVQRTVVSQSNGGEAETVVLKKKPKCKCCVIQ